MAAIDGQTFLWALIIDFGIGLGAFILFSILRIIRPTTAYYNPRWYYCTHPDPTPQPLTEHTHEPVHELVTGGTAQKALHSNLQQQQQDQQQQQSSQHQPKQQLKQLAAAQAGQPGSSSNAAPAMASDAGAQTAVAHAAAAAAATGGQHQQGKSGAAVTAAAVFEAGMDDETGLAGVPPFWAPLPPKLPRTVLTWIWPLVTVKEAALIKSVGLDAVMLIRHIRFALLLLFVLSVWCIGVVLPVNLQGGNVEGLAAQLAPTPTRSSPAQEQDSLLLPQLQLNLPNFGSNRPDSRNRTAVGNATENAGRRVQLGPGSTTESLAEDITAGRYVATNLDKFSLANISAGSNLLWVHLASVFVVTFVTLALLWRTTSSALRLYLAHLASPGASTAGATHTALLRDIPGVSRGTFQLFHRHKHQKQQGAPASKPAVHTGEAASPAGAVSFGSVNGSMHHTHQGQHPEQQHPPLQQHQQHQQHQQQGRHTQKPGGPLGEGVESTGEPDRTALLLLQHQQQQQQQQDAQEYHQQLPAGAIPSAPPAPSISAPAAAVMAAAAAEPGDHSLPAAVLQPPLQLTAAASPAAPSAQQSASSSRQPSAQPTLQLLHSWDNGTWPAVADRPVMPQDGHDGYLGRSSSSSGSSGSGNGVGGVGDAQERDWSMPDVITGGGDQQQQQQQEKGKVSILIPPVSSSSSSSSSNSSHPPVHKHPASAAASPTQPHHTTSQQQPLQHQPQGVCLLPLNGPAAAGAAAPAAAAAAAASGHITPLGRSGSSGEELRQAQRQRVMHGEWKRATAALASGMTLQEFVTQEFTSVYGRDAITAVHLVSYSPRVNKLVQQYNTTRSRLQDLLDHYNTQLQKAEAAAAAAAAKRLRKQQLLQQKEGNRSNPVKAVGRAVGVLPAELPRHVVSGGSSISSNGVAAAGLPVAARGGGHSSGGGWWQQRAHKVKPIKILQLPLPDNRTPSHQTAATAPTHSPTPAAAAAAHLHTPPTTSSTSLSLASRHIQQQQQQQDSQGGVVGNPLFALDSFNPLTTLHSAAAHVPASSNSSSTSPAMHPASATRSRVREQAVTPAAVTSAAAAAAAGTVPVDTNSLVSSRPVSSSSGRWHVAPDSHDILCVVDRANSINSSSSSSSSGSHPWPTGGSSTSSDVPEVPLGVTRSDSQGSCGGKGKGDALGVLLLRLADIRGELAEAQAAAEDDPYPAALITFRTRTALAAAVGAHHVAEASAWRLRAAPPPDGLLWSQLGLRGWQVAARRRVVTAVLVAVAFFYVIPVSAVQALLQVDRLEDAPVIGTLVNIPVVRSLLTGVLPGLALRIFVLLLPVLLYYLNRRAGAIGQAEMDGHVATHYFGLQVVIVFLASFISGTVFNQLALLLSNPEKVLAIIGTGVPQTANFFMLYIIFSAFVGRAWTLLRPWGLLMTGFRLLGARKGGKRARRRAVLIGTYRMFGPALPGHSMILLLSVVFSVIQPFVLLCGLVYFAMSLVVESYNWGWVFRRPYEGGGALWKQVFRHVIIALYLFQLVMIALLAVKRFLWVLLLIIPVLVTMLVHRLGSSYLQRSWGVMSMRAARELDLADAAEQHHQQQQQQQLAYSNSSSSGRDVAGGAPNALLNCQQQQQQVGHFVGIEAAHRRESTAGSSSTMATDWQLQGSLSAAWGELYRPPGQRLLLLGPKIEEGLRHRVVEMQQRLARHHAETLRGGGYRLRPSLV